MNNTQKYILVVTAVLILVFVAWGVSKAVQENNVPKTDVVALAQCLASKKVTMYGAYWCSHCQNQKALFGDAFKYVPYVECTENEKSCTSKGVQGFPTWLVPDASGVETKLEGEQSFEALSKASECPLTQVSK